MTINKHLDSPILISLLVLTACTPAEPPSPAIESAAPPATDSRNAVDLIIEGLMEHLKGKNSWFTQPDFPYAETWWWKICGFEVRNEWILSFLTNLNTSSPVAVASS